jgi:hypothetical protein
VFGHEIDAARAASREDEQAGHDHGEENATQRHKQGQ